jgi:tRNA A-37 threonylcarbamoyl transferase component Bud32
VRPQGDAKAGTENPPAPRSAGVEVPSDIFALRPTEPSAMTLASTPFAPHDPLPEGSLEQGDHGEDAFLSRYEPCELLGVGGMGEVRLVRDTRTGRSVALKAIRPERSARADLRERFVREARIQAQLEHPGVVPVYDLVQRPGGAFFTMRRVHGATLEQVLEGLARRDPDVLARYSRRKLLSAFGSVCMTVDFAHARGIIHRDLKPANVMFGDFGEVYVLDWGVAKVGLATDHAEGEVVDADVRVTEGGALLGTVGYMAPEQLAGGTADARSDIYSLGAMLFELLAGVQLHQGKSTSEVIQSTVRGADARASRRVPEIDVPPELEAICIKATAVAPSARHRSARELYEEVEHFLDGDRDFEQRRAMAEAHARAASQAADLALREDNSQADDDRRRALREAGRALALDAANDAALRTILRLRLGLESAKRLPDEVVTELHAARLGVARRAGRFGAAAYGGALLFAPFMIWMGVRDWPLFLAGFVALFAAGVLAMSSWARTRTTFHVVLVAALTSVSIGLLSRALGPWMLLPVLAGTNTMALAFELSERQRWLAIAVGVLSVVVPAGLEWAGVIAPSYVFANGTIVVLPHLLDLPRTPTLVTLAVMTLGTIVLGSLFLSQMRRTLDAAQRRLVFQAWQLRQLVPDEAQPLPPPSSSKWKLRWKR